MKLVALLSGGKDSMFNMLQCIAAGHDVVAVANIEPETKEELDSYMYQSVGHQAVSLIAITLGLPIYRQKTKGKAVCKNKTYTETIQDEVEDMVQLLQKVKRDIHIDGVSVGAIASDYQRTRVENVCTRLGLKCFAYLWRRDQIELLQEMIDADLDAIIIKVASIGLNDVHLGLHIRDIKDHLIDIHKKYGVNVCGEGGEYETLTTDCPLFQRKITITEYENVILSNDAFAPVAFLDVKNAILKPKVWGTDDPIISLQTRLAYVKSVVKDPYKYIEDCIDEIFPQNKAVSTSDILPFPFESKPNLGKTSESVGTYWKSSSTTSQHPHPSHKVTISSSETSACDTSSSNLNYSSGWCCIGNVTGKNFAEAVGYLQRHFETSGYEARDVVLVNLYLRDMREFSVVNKIYSQHMPEVMPPARVCVGVPLPPDVNILIVVLAHKSVSKSQKVIAAGCEPMREVMHVQSISHWAPANIGPYSQCVRVGGLYYLAGQIPLIPGTMEILNKPIVHQCKLTLRHVSRVLEAMDDSLDFSNVFQAICYVTSEEVADDVPNLWSYVTKNETAVVAVLVVSALPKNAQMEWEVVACSYDRPQVHECVDVINEFSVRLKRCIYSEPYTSSIVCNVVPVKKSEFTRKQRELTPETLKIILKYCLQFIKKEVKNIGSHMCMLKLFYKHNYYKLGETVVAGLRTVEFDHKVVTSGIPVVACSEPEVIMTITGMCH